MLCSTYWLINSQFLLQDGKFLFRFYLARQQYKEATKTALIIATEEQNSGKKSA